jgi:murein DD-endopeptidase MepM/ murein hydrolase activator NlpD
LKGEVLSKSGASRFTLVVLFASFTTGSAFAQSQSVQSVSKEPVKQQSTNQIVGAEQKPAETNTSAVPDLTRSVKPQEPQIESFVDGAVVPPAPVIVKKNTNAVMIPAEGGASVSKTNSESTYATRPAVTSNVSVGSIFGYRRDPFTRRARFHSGVDIKARWGDPVGASQAGIVTFAGWYHGYGNLIIVSHGGGVTTHYAHLSSFEVEVGSRVERGTIIGRAGSTGRATSPHLHYEVRLDGNALNPFQALTLDPSSDYFKQRRPSVEAGRSDPTQIVAQPNEK